MSKEYQKTTGTAQSLDEGVQQMREKVLEYEEAVEEKQGKLKELKLRYLYTALWCKVETFDLILVVCEKIHDFCSSSSLMFLSGDIQ